MSFEVHTQRIHETLLREGIKLAFTKHHFFSICPLNSLDHDSKARRHKLWGVLQAYHCADFKSMMPETRRMLEEAAHIVFGLEPPNWNHKHEAPDFIDDEARFKEHDEQAPAKKGWFRKLLS